MQAMVALLSSFMYVRKDGRGPNVGSSPSTACWRETVSSFTQMTAQAYQHKHNIT